MTIPALVWSVVTFAAAVGLFYLFLTRTALGRGFAVPFRTIRRAPVTTQYPDVKREPQPRFHGRHQLNFYEDGLEKCIGCELCAWACPADAIFVQGADNTAEARYSPGERYASDYQINYNRCIFCGLCIEACPTRALTMTHEYELSSDTRQGLIYSKEQLLAPAPEGATRAPHRDEDVRARGFNYYGGLAVTPPDLKGGEYAPAGPASMVKAGAAVGGLRERTSTVPGDAEGIETESAQGTVGLGLDDGHLREAASEDADGRSGTEGGPPALEETEDGTRRADDPRSNSASGSGPDDDRRSSGAGGSGPDDGGDR